MGTKERKQREKERRKNQILTAAIDLISEQGFEKTTMDEIAEHAELSKGTLYIYFKDKATLHQAIKKKGLAHLHEKYLKVIQEDLNGAELIKKMMTSFIDFITQHATFTKALLIYERINKEEFHEEKKVVEECRLLENELLMLIIRSIQIGVQDGSIKTNLPPKIIALMIGAQMNGILQFYLSDVHPKVQGILTEYQFTMTQLMELYLDIQFHSGDIT